MQTGEDSYREDTRAMVALVRKLQAFRQSLPPAEQKLLHYMMRRTKVSGEATSLAHGYSPGLTSWVPTFVVYPDPFPLSVGEGVFDPITGDFSVKVEFARAVVASTVIAQKTVVLSKTGHYNVTGSVAMISESSYTFTVGAGSGIDFYTGVVMLTLVGHDVGNGAIHDVLGFPIDGAFKFTPGTDFSAPVYWGYPH